MSQRGRAPARPRRHALTRVLASRLPRPLSPDLSAFLDLTDRRLRALRAPAPEGPRLRGALGLGGADRALARRVLRRHEGGWHDGDENLVRGLVEREGLPAAADSLAGLRPPAATVWFYLWMLESLLPDAVPPRPGGV